MNEFNFFQIISTLKTRILLLSINIALLAPGIMHST